jgi:DNA-binding LacI/PurR family transcriptional regulator
MAFGVMAALRRAGIHCPDDVSVAAFDDHPMSQYWGLTTISQHAHQQGVRSATALLNAMRPDDEPVGPGRHRDLAVELLVRETTAAPFRRL